MSGNICKTLGQCLRAHVVVVGADSDGVLESGIRFLNDVVLVLRVLGRLTRKEDSAKMW